MNRHALEKAINLLQAMITVYEPTINTAEEAYEQFEEVFPFEYSAQKAFKNLMDNITAMPHLAEELRTALKEIHKTLYS